MNTIRKKQIVVLSLVLLIIVAAYLQYNFNQRVPESEESTPIGAAIYVDDTMPDTNAIEVGSFFNEAKLEREISLSKNTDALKAIANDDSISQDLRDKAYDRMINLIDLSEKKMKLEIMIKEKGFSDVLVEFAEDGSVDVIVKADKLTQSLVAQISDVVSRQANVTLDLIHIKNKL